MNFYIDLDTLTAIAGINDRAVITRADLKRGDFAPFRIRFMQDGALVRLNATTVLSFAAKEAGKYDDDPVVFEDGFVQSDVEDPDADPYWTGNPSFNTAELDALFLIDDDSANDPPYVDLMAEFTWIATGDLGPTTIRNVTFRVLNDVYRGGEMAPTALPTPDDDWVAHGHAQTLTNAQKLQLAANAGFPTYATLSLANAGEAEIGSPFFDTTLFRYRTTTDIV